MTQRPFRSPHHTASDAGLLGGNINPTPGEISLAHNGVLFLDELPEFKRTVLETMRQPLEDGKVTISRAAGTMTFPSQFMLVAAMNPTPDGKMPGESKSSPRDIQNYLGRISGPLLDRIDLHVEVPQVKFRELQAAKPGETSAQIRKRVIAARRIQQQRFAGKRVTCNARMGTRELKEFCALDEAAAEATLEVRCGKGTYVRVLAQDLAESLGTLGYVSALRRTRVGPWGEERAISLETLAELVVSPAPVAYLHPITAALADIPAIAVTGPEAQRLKTGQPIRHASPNRGAVCAMADGLPVAVAEVQDGEMRAVRVFNL